MTEEENREFQAQMGDLRNFYEESINALKNQVAELKGQIADLEKQLPSGTSRAKKTAGGFAK